MPVRVLVLPVPPVLPVPSFEGSFEVSSEVSFEGSRGAKRRETDVANKGDAMRINQMTQTIIGCAIEVHRHLGPGLLENAYEAALCRELALQRVEYQQQKRLPLTYKGMALSVSYRLDVLVSDTVVVEVKAVEALLPIHEAQLLTYLKLGGYPVGLLLNFNVSQLRDGIARRVLGLEE